MSGTHAHVRSPFRTSILVAAVVACGDHTRVSAPPQLELARGLQPSRLVECTVSWANPAGGLWTTATNWSPAVVPGATDDVCVTLDGTYTVTVRGAQTVNTVTIGAEGNVGVQTVNVQGFGASSVLTAASGISNAGVILLSWGSGTNGTASSIAVTNGVLANSGTLRTVADAIAAPRSITANLVNTGTVSIEQANTALNKPNGVYENHGVFTIPANRSLAMQGNLGQTFKQMAGTLNVIGTFNITQEAFEYLGGAISGFLTLTSTKITMGPGGTGPVDFRIRGTSELVGDIAAGQVFRVQGTGAGSTLTSADDFTNAGRIDLSWASGTNGTHSTIAVTAGTLTNSGTIETFSDAISSPRVIAANLLNTGSVLIGHQTTLNKPNGVYENRGTWTMAASRPMTIANVAGQVFRQVEGTLTATGAMTLQGQTFEVAGGTIVGRPVINDGVLRFLDGCTGTGDFSTRGANVKLEGDIPAGYTVRVHTNSSVTSTLTSAEGFTNAGTIELQPGGSGSNNGTRANLTVTSGTLTNTGIIRTMNDVFGGTGRIISADLVNKGRMDLRTTTSLAKPGGTYVNENEIMLTNRTLLVTGQTFTNTGQIDGGGSSGKLSLNGITAYVSGTVAAHMDLTNVATHLRIGGFSGLNVVGNYRMITGGSLNIVLDAPPQVSDKVWISGSATLLGTLNVTPLNATCLDGGLSFEIMRYASRSGDFAVKNGFTLGGGRAISAVPGPTNYVLTTTGSPCVASDATPPVVVPTVTGTLGDNGWYTSDVTVTWSVTDAESAVSSTGCANQSVTIDTPGVTFTCSATSAGGNTSESVTIMRDATAPDVKAEVTTNPNGNGWYNHDVTVEITINDALSGVTETSAVAIVSTEGANQHLCRSFKDLAGNEGTGCTTLISIDKTPPSVAAARAPSANANGWNNSDVTATYSATDALSGIDGAASATQLFSLEGAGQGGSRTFTDLAGNSATATIDGIFIDKTDPIVTVTRSPLAGPNGWNDTDVTTTWTATDALSGIDGSPTATQTFSQDGANQGATRSFNDRAGNSASATITGINIDKTPLAAFCSVTPNEIWPPNGKMVGVHVTIAGTGIVSFRLRSVSNNETGSADADGWSLGSADLDGFVLARRSGGGAGRVYSLTYDIFGNSKSTSCTVTVRTVHDQSDKR